MKTLAERRAEHEKVSKKIEELGSEGLAAILKEATQVHSGIGGTAVKLEIDGVPVFAKQIAISDLEMENLGSTANLFNLPTYYQYGVGSAGFGAWRELEAHKMTTDWVLKDECPNFPLMYGHAVLPREKPEPMKEEMLDEMTRYWGGSEQVKERLKGIDDASHSVVVFLEAVGRSNGLNPRLDYYIHPQASDGDTTKPDMAMVERELKATCDFMESKGMIHFDAHHGNILTDGDRLYFADFGLATSLDFDLSAEEREFFEKNRGYDRSLATAGLSCHPRAEFTREELSILPEVREVSDRYQAASDRYRTFTRSLREDFTKTTPYPAAEMQALHQQVDSEEKKDAKESFVEKLGLQKPDEKPRSFVEAAQAGKYGKMKSQGGANEI
jgi:serine/threonine protein kinase